MADFQPAKKALGQNFLHDQQVIQRIVASLSPRPGETVIEIGPGRGALTDLLLDSGCNLHVIEFDYALADYWQSRAEQCDNLTVHQGNVLKVDLNAIASGRPIKVIGNLPYNISSQILISLLSVEGIVDSVVMLQLEMVERIVAEPNNKTYGRLSVMLQQHFYCDKIFKVPSGAFTPAPKVDSAMLRLTPKKPQDVLQDTDRFAEIVKAAFAQRRKTLRNNLKKLITAEQMQTVGINPTLRAENLSVEDFVRLSQL
ncbi:MAG: 16S rRNA (adenine(1518)-N(6)/adenine(1519)-N(6))-dimethyltransferase RsmA [Arenicella sp.]